ncbi:MAG: NUDIX domain-containing protein [bacterium]
MIEMFSLLVRAVILNNGEVLLCQKKGEDYYFFPGGHVEFAEKAELTLARELKEEIGVSPNRVNYIGTVENLFEENGKKHHEINLVFKADIGNMPTKSLEDHINFYWIKVSDIKNEKILPIALKGCITEWVKNHQRFWGSQNL